MMDISKKSRIATVVTGAVMGALGQLPNPAEAQESERALVLEEVIVTAQKREESLQDAPIAISAFSADDIEALGISEAQQVALYTPNMVAARQPASSATVNYTIRGITQTEPVMSVDPAVGIYMNGVYMARNNGLAFEVVDIERMEVLRGPQGTLYGRNSTGGAVNIVTAKPTGEFGFQQKFSAGNRGLIRSHSTLETGEAGGLSAKLSYLHSEVDGYIDNDTPDALSLTGDNSDDFGAKDSDAFSVALHWDASDTFSADYNYDQSDATNMPAAFQLTAVTPNFVAGPNPNPTLVFGPGSNDLGFTDGVLAGTYASFGNVPTATLCSLDPACVNFANTANPGFGGVSPALAFLSSMGPIYDQAESLVEPNKPADGLVNPYAGNEALDISGHSLTLTWDVADQLQIKSITAYREMENEQFTDLSGGAFNDLRAFDAGIATLFGGAGSFKEQDQFSQEIQFIGSLDRIEYVAGIYYFEEEGSENKQETVAPLLGAFSPRDGYTAKNDALAVFGQLTYTPALLEDRLRVTLGLRYTEDGRELEQFDGLGNSGNFSEDFDNISGDITLNYEWADTLSTYVKYANGYKAGGFMARTSLANQRPFAEETVDAFEIGLKSQFWDDRVRLNAAIFHNTFEDLQLSQFVPGSGGAESILNNAGEATIQGIELELVALLAEGLTVNVNYGLTDAEYDEYRFVDPIGTTCGAVNSTCDISNIGHFPTASDANAS
ncbi:MAG: TonB-dependent receptor, partial [Pseudomonadales bacterium]